MTQTNPQTFMRKFYLWWKAMDAVQARRGQSPLGYEVARRWFEAECEPEDVPSPQKFPLVVQPLAPNKTFSGAFEESE